VEAVTSPTVSICVPTYARAAPLDRAIECLCQLDPPDGGYEIIVVDDGSPSSEGIPALLEAWAARSPVPLRYHSLPQNQGPGVARNRAWRMSQGAWIAFTDDDCRPDRGWLRALLDTAGADDADVVQGRTLPDPNRAHLLAEPFARSMRVEDYNGYFQTCNILYRRALLKALGGFDEDFRLIADDTDLGWRAEEAGATVVFASDALVHHDVVVGSWVKDLRSRKRWADVVRMVAKHPGARRLAWKPYIYRRSHVPALVLLAALCLTVPRQSRRAGTIAVAAALAFDLRSARRPRDALVILQTRVSDAYEIGLLLCESVKHRTLLL